MPDISMGPDAGPDQQQETSQYAPPPAPSAAAALTWVQAADFGSAGAGQTVASGLLDVNLVPLEAPSTTGVAEYQAAGNGTGIYCCQFGLPLGFSGYTVFVLQTGSGTGQCKVAPVNLAQPPSPTIVTEIL